MSTRYVWERRNTASLFLPYVFSGWGNHDDKFTELPANVTLYAAPWSNVEQRFGGFVSPSNAYHNGFYPKDIPGYRTKTITISYVGEEFDITDWLQSFNDKVLISPFYSTSATSVNLIDGITKFKVKVVTWMDYFTIACSEYTVTERVTYRTGKIGTSIDTYTYGSTVYSKKSSNTKLDYPDYVEVDSADRPNYMYKYLGSDIIEPAAISYPSSIKAGTQITLTIIKNNILYDGTITYTYEVQLNGGSWTSISSTTSLTQNYTVPKGTTTFAARVKAKDNYGYIGTTYTTGNTINVINNVVPVISGSDQNLGMFNYNPPTISYIVTDENNDTVTVTIQLDSSTLDTRTVTLGQTYTVPINWWDINTGSHTVTITANDGQGGTATRTYTFTKNSVGQISFNRLRKKTDTGYQTTYIETDSDSIITNNGQNLTERLVDIASKLSITLNTTNTDMILHHRLHIKLTSEYTIDYLEMYSTNVKVGTRSLEEVLVQLETAVGISNPGTVPFDLNFERWRMKNSSGSYDIIYLEGISEHVIRPCGKSVEESLQAIEAKI